MRLFLTSLLAVLLSVMPLGAQRTLEHPSRVRITPAEASTLSLYLFGGLTTQAGVIINADGTLNASAVISPGSITFSDWDDNGCTMGEVPVYSGTVWQCGAGGGGGGFLGFSDGSAATPGGYFASDADTGLWRPGTDILAVATGGVERARIDAAGRLGLGASSVQQKLHLYEASGQVAERLERGDQETWDITVNTNLEIKHVEGLVTPLTLKATSGFVGVLNTNPAYALDVTGDVQLSGTLRLTTGVVAGHLLPLTADTYDIGSPALPWRNGWISQLNSLLFVEETAQLFGGYQIVGKQVGTIDSAVASAATTINLGETISSLPAWILIRSQTTAGVNATEYIRVVSLSSGTTYNVERDINGLHGTDPAWPDGTPFLVLGTQGDGRVELYSTSGIPRISIGINNDSAASAYNITTNNPTDFTELVRLGGLDGMPGAGTGNYGLYVGDASEFLSYFGGNLTVTGDVRANAGYIGSGSSVVTIDSSGLDVGSSGRIKGGTGVTYSAGTGFFLGYTGGLPAFRVGSTSQYMRWTGTALEVAGGAFSAPTVTGGTIQTAASGARIVLDTTALRGYNSGGTVQFEALTSTGRLTAGAGTVALDSAGIAVAMNTSSSFATGNSYQFSDSANSGEVIGLGSYYDSSFVSGTLRTLELRNDSGSALQNLRLRAGDNGLGTPNTFIELRGGSSLYDSVIVGADALELQVSYVLSALGDLVFRSTVTTFANTSGAQVLSVRTDNSATDPGYPWVRGDGINLVVNAHSGGTLFLNTDLASGAVAIDEITTGNALFPVVSDSGQLKVKNDGYNSTVTVAGCTFTFEFGIMTGKSGGC